jgi:sugar phosphate isomerase/epimerase
MGQPSRHQRVSLSGLCFPKLSAVDGIAAVAELGAASTSMTSTKLRESGTGAVAAAAARHGVKVVTTTALARFDLRPGADNEANRKLAVADIDRAAAVGAASVYTLTGPRAHPDWADDVDAYARAADGLVEYAAERGIVLCVEPTNWLFADLNFVHGFHDAIAFARTTGLRICLDLFHTWFESGLRAEIATNIDLITHVQLSDMQRSARSLPARAVPGDGDVPLASIVRWLLDAGYEGCFDLELDGPSIDAIGRRQAADQAAGWLDALLSELGA